MNTPILEVMYNGRAVLGAFYLVLLVGYKAAGAIEAAQRRKAQEDDWSPAPSQGRAVPRVKRPGSQQTYRVKRQSEGPRQNVL